ncbi:MAG: hypothetical protein WA418_14490 [Bradyrhizobium sp.]
MKDVFPGERLAPAVADANHDLSTKHGREDAWEDPVVIRAATGDLLAALNWHHGDDDIDRQVRGAMVDEGGSHLVDENGWALA